FGDQIKRCAGDSKNSIALGIRAASANLLVLVIVGRHLDASRGRVLIQPGGKYQQGIIFTALGDQPQIGSNKCTTGRGYLPVMDIVGISTRVVALAPLQVSLIPIIVAGT